MEHIYKRKSLDCTAWQFTLENFNKEWPDFIKNLVKEKKILIWSYDGHSEINGFITKTREFFYPNNWIVLDAVDGKEYISVYSDKKFKSFFERKYPDPVIKNTVDDVRVLGMIQNIDLNIFFDKNAAIANGSLGRWFYEAFNENYEVEYFHLNAIPAIENVKIKNRSNGRIIYIANGMDVVLLSNNEFIVMDNKDLIQTYMKQD